MRQAFAQSSVLHLGIFMIACAVIWNRSPAQKWPVAQEGASRLWIVESGRTANARHANRDTRHAARDGQRAQVQSAEVSLDRVRDPVRDWGAIHSTPSDTWLEDQYTAPVYPSLARRRGQEGTVWVGIHVVNGMLQEARILRSSGHALLDRAATDAIELWRFQAGLDLKYVQKVRFALY